MSLLLFNYSKLLFVLTYVQHNNRLPNDKALGSVLDGF